MATGAMTALGTTLAINPGGGYVVVAEVFAITPPNETRPTIDATHYGSTAAEFIMGLPNFGECQFSMNFIPSSPSEDMILALPSTTSAPIQITWPNGVTWSFNGIRSGYVPAAPLDNRMTAQVTFKVTGTVIRS